MGFEMGNWACILINPNYFGNHLDEEKKTTTETPLLQMYLRTIGKKRSFMLSSPSSLTLCYEVFFINDGNNSKPSAVVDTSQNSCSLHLLNKCGCLSFYLHARINNCLIEQVKS